MGSSLLEQTQTLDSSYYMDLDFWNCLFEGKHHVLYLKKYGIHVPFYSSRSLTGDTGPRTGFFYDFKQRELLIKKWDKCNEG